MAQQFPWIVRLRPIGMMLLKNPDIDIVIISTLHATLAEIGFAASSS